MKRKKVLLLTNLIALCLLVCACGSGEGDVEAGTEKVTEHSIATSVNASTTASTTVATNASIAKPTTVPTTRATKAPATAPAIVPTTKATKAPTTVTTVPATVTTKATTPAATKCGHSNTEWMIDKAATCIAEGKKQKVCADCKAVLESAVIDKTEHNYTNYKCTVCSAFQEDGLSAYLSDWVQKNGKAHGETISLDFYIDDILYGFTYNTSGNYFYFSLLDENYNDFLSMKFTETAGIYDLAYIQGTEPNTREVYGKIDASKFTENTPITVEKYLGNSDGRPGAVENCRICTGLLLESIETALDKYKVGLSLKDLGFSQLK